MFTTAPQRWAAVASIAVHAVLLIGVAGPVLLSAGAGQSTAFSTPPAMVSRLLQSSVTAVEPANPGAESFFGARPASEGTLLQPATASETLRQESGSEAPPTSPVDLAQNTQRTPPGSSHPVTKAAQAPESGATGQSANSGYRDAQLDPPPRPIDVPEPLYPDEAGQREGVVVLTIYIGADGKVDRAIVVRAAPPGLFEKSALAAFAQARFSPGYYLGVPVPSQITIELNYSPTNRGGAVSGQGAVR